MSTLKSQLQNCISKSLRIGESKRSYKAAHDGKTDSLIFGIQTAETLRSTANQFSKWMERNYPDVKVRHITAEHVNEWIQEHENNWSRKTVLDKMSDMRSIMAKAERVYHKCRFDAERLCEAQGRSEKVRDRAMGKNHYEALRMSFLSRESRSEAVTALELGGRFGLRIAECADYRNGTQGIDLENRILRVVGKNGKWRNIPIREKDLQYMTALKAHIGERGRLCGTTRAESLDRAIRREMERIGISEQYERTTEHAIRKMYARERMSEEREKGLSEREAWEVVQHELGHGERFRQPLYDAYIGG